MASLQAQWKNFSPLSCALWIHINFNYVIPHCTKLFALIRIVFLYIWACSIRHIHHQNVWFSSNCQPGVLHSDFACKTNRKRQIEQERGAGGGRVQINAGMCSSETKTICLKYVGEIYWLSMKTTGNIYIHTHNSFRFRRIWFVFWISFHLCTIVFPYF